MATWKQILSVLKPHWVFSTNIINLQDDIFLISYVVFHPLSGTLSDNFDKQNPHEFCLRLNRQIAEICYNAFTKLSGYYFSEPL